MALARYCILVNVITFLTCAEIQNPCENTTILVDDGSRRRSCSYSTGKCDRYLMPSWYRVKLASTGEDLMMPTDPPAIDSCGAHYPIWLNGEHPAESDGIVDRVGCSTYMNTKCNSRYKIKIRNCTDYMVYYLVRAFGCNERYCFEGNNVSNGGECGPPSTSTLLKTTSTAFTTSSLTTAHNPTTTTSPSSPSSPTSNPKSTAAPVPTTLPNVHQGLNNGIVNNGNSRSDQHISNDDEISEKDDDGVPISAFIAMAVLSIVLIIVVVLLIFYMIYKKRDRNQANLEKYIVFEPVSDLGCKKI